MGKLERKIGTENQGLYMPPYSTCQLCKNRMNDVCLEKCAPAKDYSEFGIREGIDFNLVPAFPMKEFMEEMSPRVRQIVVAAYMSLMIDYLQGRVSYVQPNIPRLRKADDGSRSRQIPALVQIAALLTDPTEKDTPRPDNGEAGGTAGK